MSDEALWATRGEKNGVLIRLRAQPGASRNEVAATPDGVLKVRVTAVAIEGAANRALVKILAKALSMPKSSIAIRSGKSSRDKVFFVEGISEDEVNRRLAKPGLDPLEILSRERWQQRREGKDGSAALASTVARALLFG